jgi:hypothetical protein
MSAKTRARLALQLTTSLDPDAALAAVKTAAAKVKGGGTSLLTSGLQNIGAQVNIEREKPGRLTLSITSGKRLVELCTFSAVATAKDGATSLRVGGLETYRTNQPRLLYLIPVGPKSIAGMAPYKRFLEEVTAALARADPTSTGSISSPDN